MARADIGEINCPICGMSGAHVRETERGRAYIVCDECVVQIFARGAESDKKIRAAMTAAGGTVAALPVAPVVEVDAAEKPSVPEESTIFDYLLKGVKK